MEDQRNQAIGMLWAGSMVNNIAHHFGRSRQTIHNLVNRLLGQPGTVQDLSCEPVTGSARDRARPSGRARATTLGPCRVISFTQLRYRFNQQPVLLGG